MSIMVPILFLLLTALSIIAIPPLVCILTLFCVFMPEVMGFIVSLFSLMIVIALSYILIKCVIKTFIVCSWMIPYILVLIILIGGFSQISDRVIGGDETWFRMGIESNFKEMEIINMLLNPCGYSSDGFD